MISEVRPDADSRIRCLEESLSSKEQLTSDIDGPDDLEWYKWQSASDLETRGSFYTDTNSMTGDGYV